MVVKSTLLACAMALVTFGVAMAAPLNEAPPQASPKAPGQCFACVGTTGDHKQCYKIACENVSPTHKCGDKTATGKWCVESRSQSH